MSSVLDEVTSYDAARRCRRLVRTDDAYIAGRAIAPIGPRQNVVVVSSGQSGITAPGGKCEHGVYIPAPFLETDRAPFCSLCRPYEISVKKNGVYRA